MKHSFKLLVFGFCWFGLCQSQTITQTQIDSIDKAERPNKRDFEIIENVPVYKGCERKKGNTNKKKCMSQKVAQLFADNFDTAIPEDSNLDVGLVRVFVTFKIDTKGNVIAAEARGPAKFLEDEAIRVTNLIPKLKPGLQRGEPVIVPYSLPLNINLDRKKDNSERYPIYRGCDETLSNKELEACTKKRITDFIKVSFDYQMADRVFLTEESTSFQLDFTITKKGKVANVNAKANHRAVAIEAIRLAKRLPKFKAPGTKNGKPVDVPFSLLMTVYFQ
ncbi:hypothetical protein J4050_10065 [Winogradskyella sp. DF17]|uniref:TonB C-terminal domain-containing protein n=1 Tax=Winogradskyella pelagia TaxID=2819984 RepID=A0ABS3T2X6_9FLAO|nr:hypothetical protein [Winogradskyella sp. DF17]MBO3117095.1 hypothetical protein [Winogradskyella sp. DF17]